METKKKTTVIIAIIALSGLMLTMHSCKKDDITTTQVTTPTGKTTDESSIIYVDLADKILYSRDTILLTNPNDPTNPLFYGNVYINGNYRTYFIVYDSTLVLMHSSSVGALFLLNKPDTIQYSLSKNIANSHWGFSRGSGSGGLPIGAGFDIRRGQIVYLPFAHISNGKYYYGWLGLYNNGTYTALGGTYTMLDFAINSKAGEPIIAGQKK